MFGYEVVRDITSLWERQPPGFALPVALKGLVHKLYEYDKALSQRLIRRLVTLAVARSISITAADIRSERKKWKAELNRLSKWADLRDKTSGHYDDDIAEQVRLLKELERDEVIKATYALISFNLFVLKALAAVGRGPSN